MSAVIGYMYMKGRLGMLLKGYYPNSAFSSSDTESESESEADTCNLPRSGTNHNSVGPPSAATKQINDRTLKTNLKSSHHPGDVTKSQTLPSARARQMSNGSCSTKPRSTDLDLSTLCAQGVETAQPCTLCSLLVPCSDSDVDRHELIYHMGANPPDCQRIFDIYQSLLLNNVRLLGAELTVCAECRVSFSAPSELLRHLYTHAALKSRSPPANTSETARFGPAILAEILGDKTTDPPKLKDTNKTDTQLPLQRQPNQLSVASETYGHRPETDGGEEFGRRQAQGEKVRSLCQFCGGLFNDLKTHINAVHRKIMPYKCPLCERRFARRGQLSTHQGFHKPFFCKICQKFLTDKYHFKLHMEAHDLNVKRYRCDQCDKSFMRSNYLKAHKLIHSSGRKPYHCTICSKGYMSRVAFSNHMDSHTGLKEHLCAVCHKKLHSRLALKEHVKLHNKSHLCEECGKAFVNPSKLKKHSMKMHSKNRLACQ